MIDISNDKEGHNIVNDSFSHKPDGLFVAHPVIINVSLIQKLFEYAEHCMVSSYLLSSFLSPERDTEYMGVTDTCRNLRAIYRLHLSL